MPVRWAGAPAEAIAGEFIVQLAPGAARATAAATPAERVAAADAQLRAFDARLSTDRWLGADGLYLVRAPAGLDPLGFASHLADLPGVQSAEPNFAGTVFGAGESQVFPNDSRFGEQWALHNTGQLGGAVDADIDAPEAWTRGTGSASAVVAVVDTGMDYTHPDLQGVRFTNPFEIPGNGIDDEGNGYIDDVGGWDFYGNGSSPGTDDNDPLDQNNHGTLCAGVIGARGNSGSGMAGVNWDIRILPLKIGGAGGGISSADAIAAVNYVTDLRNRGINIRAVNHSYGTPFSQTMQNAMTAAGNAGVFHVCAAGNSANSNVVYPANYAGDNVIAVGGTDRFETTYDQTSFGSWVDLGAPAHEVLSPVRGGGYVNATGTSFAAPHVVGAIGLAASMMPSATVQQLRSALLGGVDMLPQYATRWATGGRLNLNGFLNRLLGQTAAPSAPALDPGSDSGISAADGVTNDTRPTFTGTAVAGAGIRVFADGFLIGQGTAAPDGEWVVTSTVTLIDGTYAITATATTPNGGTSNASAPGQLTIDTTAPLVQSAGFEFLTRQAVAFTFNEPVEGSFDPADVSLLDRSTNAPVTGLAAGYDPLTRTGRIGPAGASLLPDGNYRATLLAPGVTDRAGNPLAGETTLDSFFFAGDLNRDRSVTLADFSTLAANFNASGPAVTFARGDFDYTGTVNIGDFALLATRFNTTLAPAIPARRSLFVYNEQNMNPADLLSLDELC